MTLKFQKNAQILTGRIIGKLTVKEPLYRDYRRGVFWRCECECGNTEYKATSCDLLSGRIISCGCWRDSQHFADLKVKHGGRRQKKGETSRTYSIWAEMKSRCNNPSKTAYPRYGGRGITYCPEWEKYENFLRDMGECPNSELSIDRIDNDKGYYKENCRWATMVLQCKNTTDDRVNNTSSVKGVHFSNNRWVASGTYSGKDYFLYGGKDFYQACLARWEWELITWLHLYHGEWYV